MGGIIDWAALPVVAEMLGIVDLEQHIRLLLIIRDKRTA